ncbi:MAG: hypothetical protein EOO29_30465 [Comamonadaceae bacterium]|nr:MAG: hypothetical protein EOO29_30465 [Comamonadaceae bacterium]
MAPIALPSARCRLPVWRRLAIHGACGFALLAACQQAQADFNPFVGSLMPIASLSGGAPCPRNWVPAVGQIASIQTYSELFSVIGTTYGGNGTTTFALPDMSGRVAVGVGQGQGLTPRVLGEQGGSPSTKLLQENLPAHSHGLPATTTAATHATPGAARTLAHSQNAGAYASSGPQVTLAATGPAGGNAPVSTLSPSLVINWCIAITGFDPQRP